MQAFDYSLDTTTENFRKPKTVRRAGPSCEHPFVQAYEYVSIRSMTVMTRLV